MDNPIFLSWFLVTNSHTYDLNLPEPIDLAEREYCKFRISVEAHLKPKVSIGDYTLRLNEVKTENNISLYESDRVKCFQNFLGLTQIDVGFDNSQQIIKSSPINIFAQKATFERALSFLKMISEKSDISSVCFSVTKMNSDSKKGVQNISALIAAGNKVIEYFLQQKARFVKFPCSKTRTKSKVSTYNKSMHLDDRSIAYLCSHPESLYVSAINEADIILGARFFKINDVESTTNYKDTDIYENQVLLAFFKTFLAYLKTTQNKLKEIPLNRNQSILFDGQQYISVDRLLMDSGLLPNIHNSAINYAIENCIKCISFIEKNIPCSISKTMNKKPSPTQAVLARTHYLQIFGLIKTFYELGEPKWRGQLEYFGLRNLYKIFEFVCLVNILDSLINKGYQLKELSYKNSSGDAIERPVNEPNNYYLLKSDNSSLKLFYEPKAEQNKYKNRVDSGYIIDVVHKNSVTWTPDFLIIHQANDHIKTHVIDAKYSNISSVKEHHIGDCAFKYVTKMKAKDNLASLREIDSLTLLFSGDHDRYDSFYTDELSLINKNWQKNGEPLLPAIGAMSHNENTLQNLDDFLEIIINM